MHYCTNCGKELPSEGKFCPQCGHRVEVQAAPEPVPPQPESPEVIRNLDSEGPSDPTYHLMDPGDSFNGFRIIRMLNKDPEGIKYIAEKDGRQYVLKLFFKYKFSNLDTLINLQARLRRLNQLDNVHTARVVEVNQTHDPAYMAAEYIQGCSLARIKTEQPDRLTEGFVRHIALQLVQTAMAVRQQGLTLFNLTLSGIMVDAADSITVLSSGITYGEVDQREEIFNIGVLLAQLLSQNVLYKSIYNTERLRDVKFPYIPGITTSMNKFLADCLHRNILQRHTSLETLLRSLRSLPPVEQDEIYQLKGPEITLDTMPETQVPRPKPLFDWRFYLLIGVIIALLVFFFTYALPKIIKPGKSDAAASYIPNGNPDDTTKVLNDLRPGRQNNNAEGTLRTPAQRTDPRRLGLPGEIATDVAPKKPVQAASPIPSNFVWVPDGSFGFNRLKDNPNDNVFQDGFYMSRQEVTQADWNKYMMPAAVSSVGDRLPVDNVSWLNVIRYCNARSEKEGLEPAYQITGSSAASVSCNFNANGYRLPTEAEWEMAAKAGALYNYAGSDDLNDVAWYRDNSGGRIRSGGGKQPNAYGLYDMTGNVGEWCWDWYNANYPTALATFINPKGPDSGTLKVIRGGSVRNGEGTNLGILYRERGDPGRAYSLVGFRLVRKR